MHSVLMFVLFLLVVVFVCFFSFSGTRLKRFPPVVLDKDLGYVKSVQWDMFIQLLREKEAKKNQRSAKKN